MGGDVDENRQFIEGKVVAHYQKLNILNGGDVMKIVILLRESWSHITKNWIFFFEILNRNREISIWNFFEYLIHSISLLNLLNIS